MWKTFLWHFCDFSSLNLYPQCSFLSKIFLNVLNLNFKVFYWLLLWYLSLVFWHFIYIPLLEGSKCHKQTNPRFSWLIDITITTSTISKHETNFDNCKSYKPKFCCKHILMEWVFEKNIYIINGISPAAGN